jgi:hypothetical protein
MKKIAVMILPVLLAACGSKTVLPEISSAEALSGSKIAAAAKKLAPEPWKKGEAALAESRSLARKGKGLDAKLAALESMVYFKTAIAAAQEKIALERIAKAKEDAARFGGEREKYAALRQDAEARFLQIMAYHMEQKDEADLKRSSFETEREKYLKLSDSEKKKWDDAQKPALRKDLAYAESLLDVAGLIAARFGGAKTEKDEAESADSAARGALEGSWESARPLVDDALLKAERLLVHQRIMAKPASLQNPAESKETLQMIKTGLKGENVFIAAGLKGILISVENPWDAGASKLTGRAVKVLEAIGGFVKGSKGALLYIQSYSFGEDGEKSRSASEAAAASAMQALEAFKLPAGSALSRGLGIGPIIDPGPCLAGQCPGGRLDVIIVQL